MKLLYVIMLLQNVITGHTTSVATEAGKYPTMDTCLWAANKVYQESKWYDGTHDSQWATCVPIYGVDETK